MRVADWLSVQRDHDDGVADKVGVPVQEGSECVVEKVCVGRHEGVNDGVGGLNVGDGVLSDGDLV